MGKRLTDDELSAAAASRPGYATYPEYRPGQPERLGRLPAVPPRPAALIRLPQRVTADEVDRIKDAFRSAAHRPAVVLPPGPAIEIRPARAEPAALAALDARPARPTPVQPAPDAPLAAEPESPVFDFQPVRISEREWWRPRWHWAVMYTGARVRHGYAWTEAGARRRTRRAARKAASCG
ncbi:hypothetical protein [Micromonospora fulviviridis]|uniref:hypothetical protein n=1 Tax=Micromonospora fulviviridis TaxID=47860 RepID=UPI00379E347E